LDEYDGRIEAELQVGVPKETFGTSELTNVVLIRINVLPTCSEDLLRNITCGSSASGKSCGGLIFLLDGHDGRIEAEIQVGVPKEIFGTRYI